LLLNPTIQLIIIVLAVAVGCLSITEILTLCALRYHLSNEAQALYNRRRKMCNICTTTYIWHMREWGVV